MIEKGTIELTKENTEWFNRDGYTMTGETIKETTELPGGIPFFVSYVVFAGEYTRSGTVRDCGDHYIIARYDRYDKINKETLEITAYVEDR
jgi:hypothetical protein